MNEGLYTATKTVTEGDKPGSIYYLAVRTAPALFGGRPYLLPGLLPPSIPSFWTPLSDFVLYETTKFDSLWASAIRIAVAKIQSAAWEIGGDKSNVKNRYHELLTHPSRNQTWRSFISRVARDYMLTDNGAFVEVERASTASGSRITGLYNLDSRRCTRTGDPDVPILYMDSRNEMHELKDYQVIDLSDNPDTGQQAFGVGECAARRAYPTIRRMNAMNQFLVEKLTGAKPLAIDFITGIAEDQLQNALSSHQNEKAAEGAVSYMGTIVVPFMQRDGIGHTRIPLAELPERFERKTEWDIAVLEYCAAVGLDTQDLQPMSGQALGAGAQSAILDDKEKGKGVEVLKLSIADLMQHYIMPDGVTFNFTETDLRDRKAESEIYATYANANSALVQNAGLPLDKALNIMVDANVLPREYLTGADATSFDTVSDTEKPMDLPALDTSTEFVTALDQVASKAQGNAKTLVETELDKAKALFESLKQ